MHIPEAQAKPKVEPDSMANDDCWEVVMVVETAGVVYPLNISGGERPVNVTVPIA